MGYTKEFQKKLDAANKTIKDLHTTTGAKCLENVELKMDCRQPLIGVVFLGVTNSVAFDISHENPLVLKMRIQIALQAMGKLIESDIKKLED